MMERCLLQSTVALEAFGNAKTVRNDNSSRFGKYIKLQYGSQWRVVGARTLHFLLEKSRLITQDEGERGYHVFYQMCAGIIGSGDTKRKEALHIEDASQFAILNNGGILTQSEDVDDVAQFQALEVALTTLGISKSTQNDIWHILSALLHMGNIRFEELDDDEISRVRGAHKVKLENDLLPLSDITEMLGIPMQILVDSLRTRASMTGRGSVFQVPLDARQSSDSLQGLIKHMYGQLFAWLVGKVNESHEVGKHEKKEDVRNFIGILDVFGFEIMRQNSFEQLCINFANETLQQQFNEQIFVLEQEAYAHEGVDWTVIKFKDNQGVIDLISKKPTGLLIQMEEIGLLGRKSTDKALLQLYHNTHLKSNEHYAKPRFEGPEFIVKHFAGEVTYNVIGFLEKNTDSLHDSLLDLLDSTTMPLLQEVLGYYEQEPLLDPNNAAGTHFGKPGVHLEDTVMPPAAHQRKSYSNIGGKGQSSMRRLGSRMENKGARSEAQGAAGKVHQIATTVTVSRTFRLQLHDLMQTLRSTEPHYIKCVKPNSVKAPGGFSPHLVLQQLRYSGVLEVIRIRQEAYAVRVPYDEFSERFQLLLREVGRSQTSSTCIAVDHEEKENQQRHQKGSSSNNMPLAKKDSGLKAARAFETDSKQASRKILEKYLDTKLYQMGKTLAFLKEEGMEVLRYRMREAYSCRATKIQARLRGALTRMRVARARAAAIMIQKTWRRYYAMRMWRDLRARVVLLQRIIRGAYYKKKYQAHRRHIIKIQTFVRGCQAKRLARYLRRRNEMENEAAALIQSVVRRNIVMKETARRRNAIRKLQNWFRVLSRNVQLRNSIRLAFRSARVGHVDSLAFILQSVPEILYIRNREDKFKTLLHAAAEGGSISVASLLDPHPGDVVSRDADGNTPMHYAAASCQYGLVKMLSHKVDIIVHVPAYLYDGGKVDMSEMERRATKRISLLLVEKARIVMSSGEHRRGSLLVPTHNPERCGRLDSRTGPIMMGWLYKRRTTGTWGQRFCVATESKFMYFHSEKDFHSGTDPSLQIHLGSSMLIRHGAEGDAISGGSFGSSFEIQTPELRSKRNKDGKLFFRARLEEDTIKWLNPLRVLCKEHHHPNQSVGSKMIKFIDTDVRKSLVSAVNNYGETPLHFACTEFPPRDAEVLQDEGGSPHHKASIGMTEAQMVSRVEISSWLVENGGDVNAVANNGTSTALQRAVEFGAALLVRALIQKGGDPSVLTVDEVNDMNNIMEGIADGGIGSPKSPHLMPLLPSPEMLQRLTYLTFYLEKTTMACTDSIQKPAMCLSIYHPGGERISSEQDISRPILCRPTYFLWSSQWHVQVPLENLSPGCLAVMEMRETQSYPHKTIVWGVYHLNKANITSSDLCMEMYQPPVDMSLKLMHPADVFLSADLLLTSAKYAK